MRDEIIVDMQSPTPIDSYRFKSRGKVTIYYSKGLRTKYSIEVKSSNDSSNKIDDVTSNLTNLWKLIEVIRKNSYDKNMTVDVVDVDAKTHYKKITLATTLTEIERAEALDRQIKRIKSVRRRMVVDNKYHSRKKKPIDPKLIRPILREEKTW